MNHYEITSGNETFIRVSKAYARKHYQTETIAICPVKLRPGFPWNPQAYIHKGDHTWEGDDIGTFDGQVRNFEHYNCSCNETGYYSAFYRVITK